MTDPDLIGLFIRPLEGLGIPYMITGGVASVIYGDPRFTRDVDVVLRLRRADIPRLAAAFAGESYYVPSAEVLEEQVARAEGGHFNIIHGATALRADVYLAGDDPLHAWALGRCQRIDVEDGTIRVAPVEYVIVRKLQYYEASGSDRHLRDVAMMLEVSSEAIEPRALERWVRELDLGGSLAEARRYEP